MYIVLFLHQTTTMGLSYRAAARCISYYSYIKPQPKITCCHNSKSCISYYSYIKPQPGLNPAFALSSCISYYSYIKPQRCSSNLVNLNVVYRTIPTSNHNNAQALRLNSVVVYRTIPTSNHNLRLLWSSFPQLYIVLFLHQTTTYNVDIADKQHVTITFINKKWQSRK